MAYGMRALQLLAKFCKVILDIKVIKKHRKEWLNRSQSEFCSKTRWRNFLYIILQTLLKAI
jgi:hypothetical protein